MKKGLEPIDWNVQGNIEGDFESIGNNSIDCQDINSENNPEEDIKNH